MTVIGAAHRIHIDHFSGLKGKRVLSQVGIMRRLAAIRIDPVVPPIGETIRVGLPRVQSQIAGAIP